MNLVASGLPGRTGLALTGRPSQRQLKVDIAVLNELARSDRRFAAEFGADEEQLLLAWCQDVADAAGGLLGLRPDRTGAHQPSATRH